jgi:hypothetical protein
MGGIAATVLGVGGVAATQIRGKNGATVTKKGSSPSVASKSNADVAIPYDAAARLAFDEYTAGGKEMDFDSFKTMYEKMTVADITAKKLERDLLPPTHQDDLSIPYDAAAKLAYNDYLAGKGEAWGNEADYQQFKSKYEEMCVAQVTYKKLEREMA